MLLEHSFTVPVPVDRAWELLLDIERVAPCMPGATLTSHEGDAFTGTVKVKLGPVSLTFKGSGRFVERDEAAHRVLVTASGADSRGGGTAAAKVTAALRSADDGGTRVEVATDLDVTGKAAQFGRGLIGDVSAKLVGQFADCLAKKLADTGETDEALAAAPAVAAPAAAAAPSAPDAVMPVVAPSSTAHPEETEPIDLLAVTGVSAAVRRAAPYALSTATAVAVVVGIIWWIRRR